MSQLVLWKRRGSADYEAVCLRVVCYLHHYNRCLARLRRLARADTAGDVWLHEPVQDTLRGLFEGLSEMVAELAAWALVKWDEQGGNRTFVAPVRAWQLGPEPDTEFSGFSEQRPAAEFDSLMVGTGLVEHMRLAEQLPTSESYTSSALSLVRQRQVRGAWSTPTRRQYGSA
jgi:hypothetical protein